MGDGEASAADVNGPFRAEASSGAAYDVDEVEKATAMLRELEATAGPEPNCRKAERDADLDANTIVIKLRKVEEGEDEDDGVG